MAKEAGDAYQVTSRLGASAPEFRAQSLVGASALFCRVHKKGAEPDRNQSKSSPGRIAMTRLWSATITWWTPRATWSSAGERGWRHHPGRALPPCRRFGGRTPGWR